MIDGDLADEAVARALFDAGCDDGTFSVTDGVGYGEFLREAPSFAAAVLGAITGVESVAGLEVRRVEPEDIVTMADIAERLDRSRESLRLLVTGQRGRGGFPQPLSHSRERGRLRQWSEATRRRHPPPPSCGRPPQGRPGLPQEAGRRARGG